MSEIDTAKLMIASARDQFAAREQVVQGLLDRSETILANSRKMVDPLGLALKGAVAELDRWKLLAVSSVRALIAVVDMTDRIAEKMGGRAAIEAAAHGAGGILDLMTEDLIALEELVRQPVYSPNSREVIAEATDAAGRIGKHGQEFNDGIYG